MLLTGDLLTESHQCGGRLVATGRITVDDYAEFKLYGSHPKGRLWSRLRQTASAGSNRALLIGKLDFLPGDQVMLANTGDGSEHATVVRVSYLPVGANGAVDTWLTFQQALTRPTWVWSRTTAATYLRCEARWLLLPSGADGEPAHHGCARSNWHPNQTLLLDQD